LTPHPKAPVVVGVGQIEQRVDEPHQRAEPLEMMIAAVERAADDAGSRGLLRAANSVRVIRGVWKYGDPGRAVAERIGAPTAQTVGTPWGGNMVQSTVNQTALAIQRGELEVAVITGAEAGYSLAKARRNGIRLEYSEAPGTPDLMIAPEEPMSRRSRSTRSSRMPSATRGGNPWRSTGPGSPSSGRASMPSPSGIPTPGCASRCPPRRSELPRPPTA